jgi:hypothetical protein
MFVNDPNINAAVATGKWHVLTLPTITHSMGL